MGIENKDGAEDGAAVGCSALLACVASLERDMEESEKKVDAAVAREEYGQAQYHKGYTHAYALASLRVKRIMTQANDQGERRGAAAADLRKTKQR